jgi:hypothetical protein
MLMLMDPNQLPQPSQPVVPTPAPQAPQPSGQFNPAQYDFITNPAQPPKKTLIPTHGSSKGQRILIVVTGFVLLFILLIVGYNLLTSSSRPNTGELTSVMQQQTEIARVSELGANKSGGEKAKSIAVSTKIIVMSQNKQLSNTLTAKKVKISPKVLDDTKDAKTDATLTAAEKNGRFDDAFIQQTRTSLEDYKKTLKIAYEGSNSQDIRDLLSADYAQVDTLLESITGQN